MVPNSGQAISSHLYAKYMQADVLDIEKHNYYAHLAKKARIQHKIAKQT